MDDREVIGGLVRRFGGPAVLADEIGSASDAVKMWRKLRRVPWKWRHAVRNLAQQRGIDLTEEELTILSLEPEREAS